MDDYYKKADYIIFTDGSVRQRNGTNVRCAGYGVVLFNCATQKYSSFGGELGNRTISFAEMYAALRGMITLVTKLQEDGREMSQLRVLIISDSSYVVDAIRSNIKLWKRNVGSSGIWYKVSSGPAPSGRVQNQNLMKRMDRIMSDRKFPTFYAAHMNSHLTRSLSSYDKISDSVRKSKVRASTDTAMVLHRMNAIVDDIASKYSEQALNAAAEQFYTLRPTAEYFTGPSCL